MAFLTWTEDYRLYVDEIDEQHKYLFNLLSKLYDSVTEGAECGTLDKILTELIEYTVYHFNTEEKLFREWKYPKLDIHKQKHDNFTKKVLELQKIFRDGSATISFEVLDFLSDWLTKHTMGSDQKFSAFFLKTHMG